MIAKAIKYGTEWCTPCSLMEQIFKQVDLPYEVIDIDENPEIAEEKNITNIPYIELYDENDQLVGTEVGFVPATRLKDIMRQAGNIVLC